MGTTGAMGMADAVDEGLVSLDQALIWHLASNHYPPVSPRLVPVAQAAIEQAREEEWENSIDMPEGFERRSLKVWEIIEGLHLDSFI